MGKKRKPASKIISPDHKLDTLQFKRLNEGFYKGFDQEFVTWRLGVLCAIHQKPEIIAEKLTAGVGWGKLELKVDPSDNPQQKLKRIAQVEVVALRQHAAEVLFRLFWVHAHKELCPWIALARLRNPGDLKAAVDKYLSGKLWSNHDEKRRLHANTLWGITAVLADGSIREQLDPSVDAVSGWITEAAKIVKDAPLYNAYKHGLALLESKPFSLALGLPDQPEDFLTMEASSGLSYINRVLDGSKQRHYWQLVKEPVDFEARAAEALIFGNLIAPIVQAGALDRGVIKPPHELPVLNAELTPARARRIAKKTAAYSVQNYGASLVYVK